jgi:hypothetical protein
LPTAKTQPDERQVRGKEVLMPKVEIELPEGMTQAEFDKQFATFRKNRVAGQILGQAQRKATTALIGKDGKYRKEWDDLVKANMPKGS